ncbi:MAG: hypothetical protein QHH75_08540 [Bacillota bacterium]|nr:hypothetical protein [Bacillota bacterium]
MARLPHAAGEGGDHGNLVGQKCRVPLNKAARDAAQSYLRV